MMTNPHLLIALTIALTVYGQLVLKWQVGILAPNGMPGSLSGIISIVLSPWVLSALASAFLASLFWMAALAKMPLSQAYPFMALSFPSVALLAVLIFREDVNAPKVIGICLIVLGALVLSRAPA